MLRKFVVGALMLLLAACASDGMPPSNELLSFKGQPPIDFNVNNIEVMDDYQPAPGSVDTLMAISPASAVRGWVSDRLQAQANTGYLRVTIKQASVTDHPVQGDDSTFTRGISDELDGRLVVEFYGERRDRGLTAYATVEVTYRTELLAHSTDWEKVAAERKLLEGMMSEFNTQAEQAINQHLLPLRS